MKHQGMMAYTVLLASGTARGPDGGAADCECDVVHYTTRWHDYKQIWLVYTESLSVNLSQRQTQSCPQQGKKTHWQTAPRSCSNSDRRRERREHWQREGGKAGGREGGKKGEGEEERTEMSCGGKLKCQTIKWWLSTPASQEQCWVNSGPVPKQSTAVFLLERLCVRAHTWGRPQWIQTRAQLLPRIPLLPPAQHGHT